MIRHENLADNPAAHPGHPRGEGRDAASDSVLDEVCAALRGLRFGSVNIIVQDGVVIQIDRTEKHRLQANRRGSGP